MSTCIKDLYEYDIIKNSCRRKNILLNTNFHKNKNMSGELQSQCHFCTKKYYIEKQDRLLNKQKMYDKQNRDKINTRL